MEMYHNLMKYIFTSKNKDKKKKSRKNKFKKYWRILEPPQYVELLVKGL
jgi:hypothetical protein